jgi:hypothetical protein
MTDNRNDELPPRPGEKPVKQIQPPQDAIPLYIQGMAIPVTEAEALGIMAQLSSALQTRMAGMPQGSGIGVVRNGP